MTLILINLENSSPMTREKNLSASSVEISDQIQTAVYRRSDPINLNVTDFRQPFHFYVFRHFSISTKT